MDDAAFVLVDAKGCQICALTAAQAKGMRAKGQITRISRLRYQVASDRLRIFSPRGLAVGLSAHPDHKLIQRYAEAGNSGKDQIAINAIKIAWNPESLRYPA